jgi:hypothetical protein
MKPFKSIAHRKKLAQLVKDGKVSQDEYNKMYLATHKQAKPLADRLKPKKKN